MTLTRRSLFASAVALLALPRRVAAERLLGPPGLLAHNDGSHDDADALQAILNRTGRLDGSELPARPYYLSRGLVVPSWATGCVMSHMVLVMIGGHAREPIRLTWPGLNV